MRILEKMDAGLVAMESIRFWQDAGYNRIRVLVDAGNVAVDIRRGKIARPKRALRAAWNRQKYNGICYHVRRIGPFGIVLWDSRNWDMQ